MPATRSAQLFAFALGLIVSATPLGAQAHAEQPCGDVSGDWAATLNLPGGGPTDLVLSLTQSGCEVYGTVNGMRETPIDEGRVEGSTASFVTEVTNQVDGSLIQIEWTLTVDGDEATGTFGGAMMGTIDFVGERVPSDAPSDQPLDPAVRER